jgi:hypothetical protein
MVIFGRWLRHPCSIADPGVWRPGLSLDGCEEARPQDRVHEERAWAIRVYQIKKQGLRIEVQVEATACEGGGFFSGLAIRLFSGSFEEGRTWRKARYI